MRDTKLEKTNHEATPRHQGNLKRFLRDLHRGHEKDEKDKDRAKAEVARLNGVVSGSGAASSSSSAFSYAARTPKQQATPTQKKQQLAQLAEMGVSIPDEFRPDMAMAGEWQVTSERLITPEGEEKKPDAVALGVRKRPVEEHDKDLTEPKKTRWGSAFRSHPTSEKDDDLDALLSNATCLVKGLEPKTEGKEDPQRDIKQEPEPGIGTAVHLLESQKAIGITRESSDSEVLLAPPSSPDASVKKESKAQAAPAGIVFKKRKAKNIRQK